jgi:endonuclease/exonuclease/phosphatase family metal-dependent hydrolase
MLSVFVLLAGLLDACGDSDVTSDVPNDASAVSFLTFNTALIAQTGNLDERLDMIARDLPNTGADVLCLQEVWQPEHVDALVSKVEAVYPFAHWSVNKAEAAVGCNESETSTLIGCLTEHCANVSSSEKTSCAVKNCANAFTDVSDGCQHCVLANQTLPPEDIATTCASPGEDAAAYENQTGLLLLSKIELTAKDYLAFNSSFGDRGVLSATIATSVLPKVDLFCTHLAATQTEIDYPGTYGSWEGERADQIDSLHGFIEEKRAREDTVVVMGDLNCGPKGDKVVGEDVKGFKRLLESGLTAEYLNDDSVMCTFCSGNSLVGTSSASVMIDHVLFSNLPDTVHQSVERVFDEPSTIEVDGESLKTYHSDHYGLMVTVRAESLTSG